MPEELDINFLKDFKTLILAHVALGKKFVIITGGGTINRKYNQAAKKLGDPSDEDLDWIGIAALKLNGELVRVMFGKYAHEKIILDLTKKFSSKKPIIIGGAHKPKSSTDFDAVLAARTLGSKKVINLSNIDYVYDSDPRTNPNAKKIDKISWKEYRAIIPTEWTSKLSTPFDPVASKVAEEEGMEVVIMNGKLIDNLAKCLNGEPFLGTIIS